MGLLDLFKKKQAFKKDFGAINDMIGIGTSEKHCKEWKKTFSFMRWPEAALCIREQVRNDEEVNLLNHEFALLQQCMRDIERSVEQNERFCFLRERGHDCWRNVEQVVVELRLNDDDGNRHPHVSVSYDTDYDHVYFVIEQGRLSAFTAERL